MVASLTPQHEVHDSRWLSAVAETSESMGFTGTVSMRWPTNIKRPPELTFRA